MLGLLLSARAVDSTRNLGQLTRVELSPVGIVVVEGQVYNYRMSRIFASVTLCLADIQSQRSYYSAVQAIRPKGALETGHQPSLKIRPGTKVHGQAVNIS